MSSPSGQAGMVSVKPGPAGGAAAGACCAGSGTESTTANTAMNNGTASFMGASRDARELTLEAIQPAVCLWVATRDDDALPRAAVPPLKPLASGLWPLGSGLWPPAVASSSGLQLVPPALA